MKKWIFPLLVVLFFIGVGSLFLIPSYSYHCTERLLFCIEQNSSLNFWEKMWDTLVCVYHNVICVLGGLFR